MKWEQAEHAPIYFDSNSPDRHPLPLCLEAPAPEPLETRRGVVKQPIEIDTLLSLKSWTVPEAVNVFPSSLI